MKMTIKGGGAVDPDSGKYGNGFHRKGCSSDHFQHQFLYLVFSLTTKVISMGVIDLIFM